MARTKVSQIPQPDPDSFTELLAGELGIPVGGPPSSLRRWLPQLLWQTGYQWINDLEQRDGRSPPPIPPAPKPSSRRRTSVDSQSVPRVSPAPVPAAPLAAVAWSPPRIPLDDDDDSLSRPSTSDVPSESSAAGGVSKIRTRSRAERARRREEQLAEDVQDGQPKAKAGSKGARRESHAGQAGVEERTGEAARRTSTVNDQSPLSAVRLPPLHPQAPVYQLDSEGYVLPFQLPSTAPPLPPFKASNPTHRTLHSSRSPLAKTNIPSSYRRSTVGEGVSASGTTTFRPSVDLLKPAAGQDLPPAIQLQPPTSPHEQRGTDTSAQKPGPSTAGGHRPSSGPPPTSSLSLISEHSTPLSSLTTSRESSPSATDMVGSALQLATAVEAENLAPEGAQLAAPPSRSLRKRKSPITQQYGRGGKKRKTSEEVEEEGEEKVETQTSSRRAASDSLLNSAAPGPRLSHPPNGVVVLSSD